MASYSLHRGNVGCGGKNALFIPSNVHHAHNILIRAGSRPIFVANVKWLTFKVSNGKRYIVTKQKRAKNIDERLEKQEIKDEISKLQVSKTQMYYSMNIQQTTLFACLKVGIQI